MKRISILITFLSLCIITFARVTRNTETNGPEYFPMIDINRTWVYVGDDYANPHDTLYMKFTSNVCNVNGKQYWEFAVTKEVVVDYSKNEDELFDVKVISNPDPRSRYLREESGKVFLLTRDSLPVEDISVLEEEKMQEILLYDFTKKDGDKISLSPYSNRYYAEFTVDERDPVRVGNILCKSYGFKEVQIPHADIKCIEGIGVNSYGVLSCIFLGTIDSPGRFDSEGIEKGHKKTLGLHRPPLWSQLHKVFDDKGNILYEDKSSLGIENVNNPEVLSRTEYYTIDGLKINQPKTGEICIEKKVFSDGTIKTRKILKWQQ